MATVTSIIREDARWIADTMSKALEPLAGSTVLVTGAGGFLASFVVDALAELRGCRVIALDNFLTGLPERLRHLEGRPEIQIEAHDVIRPYTPKAPPDWIFHAASIASPTFYRKHPLETIDVNVQGTRHMLDLARTSHSKGIVFLSTSEIYGDPSPDAIPTNETYRGFVSCTGPRACYDESKRLGETLCATYHRLYGTPVKVIRPFNVYGPGQRLDDKRIIPDLVSAALRKEPLVLLSDGRATRAFCYLRDAVAAMLHVLVSGVPGEAYNVGNDEEELPMLEVARRLAEIAGPPPLRVEHQTSDDPNYTVDNPQRRCPDLRKLRALAPWTPRVSLVEGLRRTLRSYQELAR